MPRKNSSHRGWKKLQSFPLLDAILGRRSRRFGLGMKIPSGPLAYESKHEPLALSEDERLLLIAIGAGITGWNLGIPHSAESAKGSGCHYALRALGRAYPSGAAAYGSELLITDDSGSYITQCRDLTPDDKLKLSELHDLPEFLDAVKTYVKRISDKRVLLPAEYPHIGAHNHWVANQPGSTLFAPVSDQVEALLNLLWIYTSEGAPILSLDKSRYLGNPGPLLAKGRLLEERALPLNVVETVTVKHTTAEMSIAAYNIQLSLQGIGLGGWLYTGINGTSLLGEFSDEGIPGFGFRFTATDDPKASNPVGLDGVFETLIPPYVKDMHEAVKRFTARRFGKNGTYAATEYGPYLDNGKAKSGVKKEPKVWLDYFSGLAQDIWETYGRFPATVPSVATSIYTQAQHIDLDFYRKFYQPDAWLDTHENHARDWHGR